MINWHRNFEKMEPEEHHKFLISLGIDEREALNIRKIIIKKVSLVLLLSSPLG